MPVSIVVGGQFGSEGKGKVALEIVRRDPNARAVVRVGGSNSGHTAVDRQGKTIVVRQIPAGAIDGNVCVVLPPGSFIDLDVFNREIELLQLTPETVYVSPMARVITKEHRDWEKVGRLNDQIGSTQSGTGAAVLAMVARGAPNFPLRSVFAEEVPDLAKYMRREPDTTGYLRRLMKSDQRIVIEGTQGFGLSVLQGGFWPKATSRDTTAAGFLAETGLSPRDVDDVTLVLRCHPIRVAGDSGPLPHETSWAAIMRRAGLPDDFREYTTVTQRVRRVGNFDSGLVRKAIDANWPSRIVLNHLDYVDPTVRGGKLSIQAGDFVRNVEISIGRSVDWLGVSPASLLENSQRNELVK